MNERIKELAVQSHLSWCMQNDFDRQNLQKFAELIIKKCINELEVSKKGDIYTGELFNCEWNDCIDSQIVMLKEEFGIDT
jgi:hypothetical protein